VSFSASVFFSLTRLPNRRLVGLSNCLANVVCGKKTPPKLIVYYFLVPQVKSNCWISSLNRQCSIKPEVFCPADLLRIQIFFPSNNQLSFSRATLQMSVITSCGTWHPDKTLKFQNIFPHSFPHIQSLTINVFSMKFI